MPLLASVLSELHSIGLIPFIGIEAECYLDPVPPKDALNRLITHIHRTYGCTLVPEKFSGHYEIITLYGNNIADICKKTKLALDEVRVFAHGHNLSFSQDAVSPAGKAQGLHMHAHTEREELNIFSCPNEGEARLLRVAAAMLELAPSCMPVFAPHKNDYTRYQLHSPLSPSRLCIGKDNRSAALRVPPCVSLKNKRIEHRICAASANIPDSAALILTAFLYERRHNLEPAPYIWGNAFDAPYEGVFPALPTSLADAENIPQHPFLATLS